MKRQIQFKERGQALVIIAVGAVALFAFAALALDGSMVFSDRRHSQNASDTAVLAAALAKVRADPALTYQTAAQNLAAANTYVDSDPETQVLVGLCNGPALATDDGRSFGCVGLPAGEDPADFIHVHIKSVVHLTFARVVGWETMINHTDAISRATEPEFKHWYDGYGIAATHQGCWDNNNGEPFELGGSSTTIVNGAGVLVSAVCSGEDTINVAGNPDLDTTTGVCAPGTTGLPANDEASLGNPGLQTSCEVPPADYYTMPTEPVCQNAGDIQEVSNGNWVATPGYYNSTFPDVQGGQANIKLTKGIYCLKDGLDMGAGWDLTTDTNGNTVHDPATEGVFLFIPGGDVTFNGGANVTLHAISSNTNPDFKPEWLNLLMYIPPTNPADVHITGGSGSTFTGTIFAPASIVTLQGTSDNVGGTVTLDSQIIADTVKITGNTDLTIIYNEANNAVAPTNPGIELIK
jgi:hypothetical protein